MSDWWAQAWPICPYCPCLKNQLPPWVPAVTAIAIVVTTFIFGQRNADQEREAK